MARTLIVNADDGGYSDAVNEAIRACYLAGAITGASVMACGRSFRGAASMLRQIGKTEVGAHLTLTGGLSPATQDVASVSSLVGPDGFFPATCRAFLARYFAGRIRKDEVCTEFNSQVARIREQGLEVTHLDSHEHIHVLPAVREIVVALALDMAVPYVRYPTEDPAVMGKKRTARDLLRYAALKAFCVYGRRTFLSGNVCCNNSFLGCFHAGRISNDVLSFMVGVLKDGVTELAVHPCVNCREFLKASPWYRNGPTELDSLISGQWRQTLEDERIMLVPHSWLPAEGQ